MQKNSAFVFSAQINIVAQMQKIVKTQRGKNNINCTVHTRAKLYPELILKMELKNQDIMATELF